MGKNIFEPHKNEGLVQIFVSFPKWGVFRWKHLGFSGGAKCQPCNPARFGIDSDSPGPLVLFFCVLDCVFTKKCWDLPGINCGELTNSGGNILIITRLSSSKAVVNLPGIQRVFIGQM